jgi:DNA-binding MarR family transcriptional regulator
MSTEQDTNDLWRALSARTIFLHQAVADHLGLNLTDHKCLDILVHYGPMTAGKLAEASGLTTGAITGVVDRLAQKNFVTRVSDEADRRKIVVVVVPESARDIERLFMSLGESIAVIMASYSVAEQAVINDFAQRTGCAIDAFVRTLRHPQLRSL